MDLVYFLLRHTPFWAVPLLFICAEFAYIYWLKNRKPASRAFLAVGFICVIVIVYYYWTGGPDHATREAKEFIKNL